MYVGTNTHKLKKAKHDLKKGLTKTKLRIIIFKITCLDHGLPVRLHVFRNAYTVYNRGLLFEQTNLVHMI